MPKAKAPQGTKNKSLREAAEKAPVSGVATAKAFSPEQREELLSALKARFEKNMNRHRGLEWAKVQAKLESTAEKLWSLHEMERTGGEPDVVGHDKKTDEYVFSLLSGYKSNRTNWLAEWSKFCRESEG